jgi:hypothetical protein
MSRFAIAGALDSLAPPSRSVNKEKEYAPQAQERETIETLASEDEAQGVQDAIERIKCRAQTVEKESDTLFEVDDAQCDIGQYDIKLDDKFNIISMTRDE